MSKDFEAFKDRFKIYRDDVSYEEMQSMEVSFDSEKELTPLSMIDPEQIVQQLADISKKQFYYTSLYESQKRVLQTIEDEFDMWYAKIYCEVDTETEIIFGKEGKEVKQPIKRNENQKEMTIKTRYADQYIEYLGTIKQEKYKLGLIAGVRDAIKSFSYKLNNINEYAKELED